jgi:hypothetical protein
MEKCEMCAVVFYPRLDYAPCLYKLLPGYAGDNPYRVCEWIWGRWKPFKLPHALRRA